LGDYVSHLRPHMSLDNPLTALFIILLSTIG
jgi:hypothetical protein